MRSTGRTAQSSHPAGSPRRANHSVKDNRQKTAGAKNGPWYINRELSWLQFNMKVLQEAREQGNPLLERVKFLAIFANNLDEFFMIRVSGLIRQIEVGVLNLSPDGMRPLEQVLAINRELGPQKIAAVQLWRDELRPGLAAAGIKIAALAELKPKQAKWLRRYFETEIFPTLTPLAIDPGHPFPHISNLSLNLAVMVSDSQHGERLARLKIPDTFPRLLPIPGEEQAAPLKGVGSTSAAATTFVWLEDVITANLQMLFPELEIRAAYPFRVIRDADLEIEEDEASDLLASIQEGVEMRHFGSAVRLEVGGATPAALRDLLAAHLHLKPYQILVVAEPLGMSCLMELARLERPDLKYPPFFPATPPSLSGGENIFTRIRRRDLVLYHPYDSFAPVVDFVNQAARDPNVLAIKQTLYRVGSNSPIVAALMAARENGKQVAVLVELKARFDEENNIGWAQALEKAGVHVVYGLIGLKTHAKMCLVVRREGPDIVRYVHISTGNYNVVTSRLYSDLSYFTCDPAVGADVSDLFNALTGYSGKKEYRRLLVAPEMMRRELICRIEREIEWHRRAGKGYIAFKMNSLVDPDCIKALYRASQAGVTVDLQVRGICCLRPRVAGLSDHITVTAIVGRFLEHARFYYFGGGGSGPDELLMGSADLMPRNLDRRIEVLFPVTDPAIRQMMLREVLQLHLRDNVKSWSLLPEGDYNKTFPAGDATVVDSQAIMLERPGLSVAIDNFETAAAQIAADEAAASSAQAAVAAENNR